MKWTVVYQPSARNELAELWLNCDSKQALADAADKIDRALSSNPFSAGESRSGDFRILIESPLAVVFDVNPQDMLVTVWHVKEWS